MAPHRGVHGVLWFAARLGAGGSAGPAGLGFGCGDVGAALADNTGPMHTLEIRPLMGSAIKPLLPH